MRSLKSYLQLLSTSPVCADTWKPDHVYFLEVTLCILHPYTILQFPFYFLFAENPWFKGSLVSHKQKKLLLRLLQRSSSSRPFVHIGSTLGPMQKTTFCRWQCSQMPFAHENIKDRPSSISSSSVLNHLSNLLHQKRTRDYWGLFYQEKKGGVLNPLWQHYWHLGHWTQLLPSLVPPESSCRVLVVNSTLAGLTWAKT